MHYSLITSFQSENQRLTASAESPAEELAIHKADIGPIENAIAMCKQRLADIQGDIDRPEVEIDWVERRIIDPEDGIAMYELKISVSEADHAHTSAELEALQAQLATLRYSAPR
ncbi:hypothetical protein N7507_009434 [Penicillium longicatenatum]|nr:hypothetical protein N7507_009434 [Penicillium longicatenatum]